jgi:serine protease Do
MSWFEDDFYKMKKSKVNKISSRPPQQENFRKTANRVISIYVTLMILITLLVAVVLHADGLHQGVYSSGKSILVSPKESITEDDSSASTYLSAIQATEMVIPAVVSVLSYAGNNNVTRQLLGMGSGVVYRIDGEKVLVITNCHVISDSDSFQVMSYIGESFEAKLIGKDLFSDLAVLEVNSNKLLQYANFGDSDQMQIGETVIALGNSLGLGYAPTVTKGIVSSLNRILPVSTANDSTYDWEMQVIQTDAAINQGNSGGPLINLKGQVIGINSAKIEDTGVEGLGFSIPINDAKPIISQLIEYGKVKRAMMGVVPRDLQSFMNISSLNLPDSIRNGIVLVEVSGPSLQAGLKRNDVIIKLDDQVIRSTIDLRKYLFSQKKIGDEITVTYYRDGNKNSVKLILSER